MLFHQSAHITTFWHIKRDGNRALCGAFISDVTRDEQDIPAQSRCPGCLEDATKIAPSPSRSQIVTVDRQFPLIDD